MARAKFSTSPEAMAAIFQEAIPLFSKSGFSGVSMRDVANAVGISIATLYHHFPDKNGLYLRCIEACYANKAAALSEVLSTEGSHTEQLQRFVHRLTHLMSEDAHFRRLFQRELLDGDESRLRVMATQMFFDQFKGLLDLAAQLAPDRDAHMTAVSIIALVLFHLETTPLRQFMPGGLARHNDPDVIAAHVTELLLKGIVK